MTNYVIEETHLKHTNCHINKHTKSIKSHFSITLGLLEVPSSQIEKISPNNQVDIAT